MHLEARISYETGLLVNHILPNIFFYVYQKTTIHTGLEQLESEQTMTNLNFSVNYSFKSVHCFYFHIV